MVNEKSPEDEELEKAKKELEEAIQEFERLTGVKIER